MGGSLSVYAWTVVSMIVIAFSLLYVNVFSGDCEQTAVGFSDIVVLPKDFTRFSDGRLQILVSNARANAVSIDSITASDGATEFDFPVAVETGNTINVEFTNLKRARKNSCASTYLEIAYSYDSQRDISNGTLTDKVK